MADNLTVSSASAEQVEIPSTTAKSQVDPGREQLDKLKQIAKERHGRTIDEGTLKAIIARREAQLKHETKVNENKQAFESSQAKESLGSKANEAQTKALKATGVQESKSPDGLSEKDRQQVRSDPNAGPKLPPTPSKATTPEQAGKLLGTLFELVQQNGEPVDLKAYAGTLRQKPPTKAKESTHTSARSGTPLRNTPSSNVATGQRSSATTTNGSRPVPTKQPTVLPREGTGPRLQGTGAQAGTQFSVRGGPSLNRPISGDGLVNAGGSFITGSSFDGMSFNWDAFFTIFMIKSEKDLLEWRRMAKNLARYQKEIGLQFKELDELFTKMRQSLGCQEANRDFLAKIEQAKRSVIQSNVAPICGSRPERVRGDIDALRKILEKSKLSGLKDRIYLTEAERAQLPPDLRAQYDAQLKMLKFDGGTAGLLGAMVLSRQELQRQIADLKVAEGDKGKIQELEALAKELDSEIAAAQSQMEGEALLAMEHPISASRLNAQRGRYRKELSSLEEKKKKAESAENTKLADGDPKKVVFTKEDADSHYALLRQIVALDRAMASTEYSQDDRCKAYEEGLKNRLSHVETKLAETKAQLAEAEKRFQANAGDADLKREVDSLGKQVTERQQAIDRLKGSQSFIDGMLVEPSAELKTAEEAVKAKQKQLDDTMAANPKASEIETLAEERDLATEEADKIRSDARANRYDLPISDAGRDKEWYDNAIQAGDIMYDKRMSFVHNDKRDATMDALNYQGLEELNRSLQGGPFAEAVNRAIQGAAAMAQGCAAELEAKSQQGFMQAQGMINQLIQLQGMARSR